MPILLGFVMCLLAFAGVLSAEIINGNHDFKHRGPAPYKCTTPKGKTETCNRWNFSANRGWKVFRPSRHENIFDRLPSTDAHGVTIRRPEGVALYDAEWADHRDFEWLMIEDEAEREAAKMAELIERELRYAMFWQFVEVHTAGNYHLRACMTAKMTDDHHVFLPHPASGLQVRVEQWHAEEGLVTVPMVVPRKAKFGAGMDSEPGSVGITWIDHDTELPAVAERGAVYASRYSGVAYVHDGTGWNIVGDEFLELGSEVDSYVGHAWLNSAYRPRVSPLWSIYEPTETWPNNIDPQEAIWTCHSDIQHLEPGFYVIRAQALPIWRFDFDLAYTDHAGFGAIRMIYLEKQ